MISRLLTSKSALAAPLPSAVPTAALFFFFSLLFFLFFLLFDRGGGAHGARDLFHFVFHPLQGACTAIMLEFACFNPILLLSSFMQIASPVAVSFPLLYFYLYFL